MEEIPENAVREQCTFIKYSKGNEDNFRGTTVEHVYERRNDTSMK